MKYQFALIAVFICASMQAQVIMNLQLPPTGITVKEQLWNLSLINSGNEDLGVQIEMQMSDASSNQRILTAATREFLMPKGVKQIRQADILPITYNVVHPGYAVDASPTGLLPCGIYNICFTVLSKGVHGNETITDECETVEIEPLSPPSLIMPSDQERVDITRPLFTWAPPAPISTFSRLTYEFSLVEVMPTQNAADAIQRNFPVHFQPRIAFTNFQYPSTLKELDTAKTYAWQIKASNNGQVIANSEVWTFSLAKQSHSNEVLSKETNFTRLRQEQDGAYSQAYGTLYFEYNNQLNDTSVLITITDVTRPGRRTVIHSEDISLYRGINFQQVLLSKQMRLTAKHIYLVQLTNSAREKWFMKFEYANK